MSVSTPSPLAKDHEEFLDALAYILATSANTSNISWIIGDVGMGPPTDNPVVDLPFGYISALDEKVLWETATGGLGAGSKFGLDDWIIPVALTVAFQPHQFIAPIPAVPPVASAYSPAHFGSAMPYFEQPGWRYAEELTQKLKGVLRVNPVIGGEVATVHVVESKYILLSIQSAMYRAIRVTVQAQQRRVKGT